MVKCHLTLTAIQGDQSLQHCNICGIALKAMFGHDRESALTGGECLIPGSARETYSGQAKVCLCECIRPTEGLCGVKCLLAHLSGVFQSTALSQDISKGA